MGRQLGAALAAGAVWAALVLGVGAAFAQSSSAPAQGPGTNGTQANPAPCKVDPQPQPCSAGPAGASAPSAMQRFPFPGESSGASTPMVPDAPGGSAGAQAPDAPGVGPTGKANARDAFPFPGEASKPDGSGAGGSGGSSSSSSSSSDDGSTAADAQPGDAAGVKDAGSEGSQTPGRHILHRVNPIGTKLQTDDEREAEDLDIARYYTQTGDLQGAYLRSKDAVKIAPNDADAHFALAESALKLNKRDEAITEYNACLKLDPIDKEAKAARKELAKLKP